MGFGIIKSLPYDQLGDFKSLFGFFLYTCYIFFRYFQVFPIRPMCTASHAEKADITLYET